MSRHSKIMISILVRLAQCSCLLLALSLKSGHDYWGPIRFVEGAKMLRLFDVDDDQAYRLALVNSVNDWRPSSNPLAANNLTNSLDDYNQNKADSSSASYNNNNNKPALRHTFSQTTQFHEPKRRFVAKRSHQDLIAPESLILQTNNRPIEGK